MFRSGRTDRLQALNKYMTSSPAHAITAPEIVHVLFITSNYMFWGQPLEIHQVEETDV